MILLEDLKKDAIVKGILSGQAVKIVTVEPIGPDAVTIYYTDAAGKVAERMLFRSDEISLELVVEGRPWSLDADGSDFRLAAEAYRIHLAHLFDPLMAIHSSNVDPLPHQITAVYETMLPKQPLRFVLADDPGAGKTIMAGLLIRELMVRGDVKRCLIVAPGNLVDQWQDEMEMKFHLHFEIFSREMVEASYSANPFVEKHLLIARIDQLSRAEDLKTKLEESEWDLVVVDEAHKMSATYFGRDFKRTQRYSLGESLGKLTRHFLLMTATPHNGKEEDFQAFMALIDSDRFYGKYRDGVHQVKIDDLMRRMIKEDLLKFDSTPLFPERFAHTVKYELSDLEKALYAAVTNYVTNEMNRAEKLGGQRKGNVGFALTILQRRLASSPEAIYQSLKRRHDKLLIMLEEVKLNKTGASILGNLNELDEEDINDLPDGELEDLEEELVNKATAARTIHELEAEIHILKGLLNQAKLVRASEEDRKWIELSALLQNTPEMFKNGHRRKIIIFTEHRDTLNYLLDRISSMIGNQASLVLIHGGTKREERKKNQELFTNDKDVYVLLATDAAGEGVNLQCANLMINYDLPWNPNRIEQRFGRIHRIGQEEICHLWNLVASETREGAVFLILLDKLEKERNRLGGKVFDILGEAFENVSLRELLIEAIRYGDQPEVRNKIHQKIEGALDSEHLKKIIEQNALATEHMDASRVFHIKEEMQKAEALRLQPFYISSFFATAFSKLGGQLKDRESGRFEITYVPPTIRSRDRIMGSGIPVLERYERVCFQKDKIRIPGKPMASLICPGHPLMDAAIDLMLKKYRPLLKQGAILINDSDDGITPRMLYIIDHSIRDGILDKQGIQRTISRRLQFVFMDAQSQVSLGGHAPYLDYRPASQEEQAMLQPVLQESWLQNNMEKSALAYAAQSLVPNHYTEVKTRRERIVNDTLAAVHERLTKEINHWTHQYNKLKTDA